MYIKVFVNEDDEVTSTVTTPQSSRGSELHIRHSPSLHNPTTSTNPCSEQETNLTHDYRLSLVTIDKICLNILRLQFITK